MGNSYGYQDAEGVSPTEREYDKATDESKYRIAFICNIMPEQRDYKEQKFISKVEGDVIRRSFKDFEELRSGVYASLILYLEMNEYLHLLPFDATVSRATIDDIDEDKIRRFIRLARNKRNLPIAENTNIKDLLTHLALMLEDGRILNAAILLFGKQPQKYFITSEVKCAMFYGTEITKPIPSYQVYKGDVFELIEHAVGFVMSRIDARVGTREEQIQVDIDYEIPLLAVTEAIVNAVAHRDYRSNGSVQVMLFKDRLEVWNPGTLPIGLTVEKLTKPHQSLPTNPLLANPMYLAGSIERLGTGTRDIIHMCENANLKTPEFAQDGIFKVILWRKESFAISKSSITVLGIGGAGGNMVAHMYKKGIHDVDFIVCNTDDQALYYSPIQHKIQLGHGGMGAANDPINGQIAAEESINQVRSKLEKLNTKMLFLIAGLGGGTGSGATPVIAKMAREMGISTIAVVTTPFTLEGQKRCKQSTKALLELRNNVDSLFEVNANDVLELYSDQSLIEIFHKVDNILYLATKSISEIVSNSNSPVNVDMADIISLFRGSNTALLGVAIGKGENRAKTAIQKAIESPLVGNKNILCAKNILIHILINNSNRLMFEEVSSILNVVQSEARCLDEYGQTHATNIIWGIGEKKFLEDDELEIVIIGSGK